MIGLTGALVVALGDQVCDRQERRLIRRIGELVDNLPGLVREGLSPLLDALDPTILLKQRQDPAERNRIVIPIPQNRLYQTSLIWRRALERVDQRQRHFPFPQIPTD